MIRIAINAVALLALAQPVFAGNKQQQQTVNPFADFFQLLSGNAEPASKKGRQTREHARKKIVAATGPATPPQPPESPVRPQTRMGATAPAATEPRAAVVDSNGNLSFLIAKHASAHNVPASLIRRVIRRESRGNPRAVSKGNYGLMQIRLGTARAMGYRGSVAGLLDADTNMAYAVKYLAGAYRVAGGNHDRAVRLYASGYYYAAKRKGLANRDGTLKPAADARAF